MEKSMATPKTGDLKGRALQLEANSKKKNSSPRCLQIGVTTEGREASDPPSSGCEQWGRLMTVIVMLCHCLESTASPVVHDTLLLFAERQYVTQNHTLQMSSLSGAGCLRSTVPFSLC